MNAKAKREGESVAAYQKALALDPDNQSAAFNLALAYKTAGRTEAAEAVIDGTRVAGRAA